MSPRPRTEAQTSSEARAEWRFPNRATPPGSSAYYSIRMAGAPKRDALAALFAWRGEVRSVLDQVSDPGVARTKLDWWRDEIARTLDGAPRHPLSQALAPAVADARLPGAPFADIIAATEQALGSHRHATREAQREADSNDLGALFELIARCEGGVPDQGLSLAARQTGAWCAQVRRLRDAGWLLRQGREVFTADQLAAAGMAPADVTGVADRERLTQLLATLADELLTDPAGADADRRLTPALRVQLRIHRDLLDVLEHSRFDVTDQRIALTPLRKLWIAWRAAR